MALGMLSGILAWSGVRTKGGSWATTLVVAVLLYIVFFTILEILEIRYGYPIWDQTERISRCYDWFEVYLNNEDTPYDKGGRYDYTESLFMGNYGLSVERATQQKYEYLFQQLGLQPGMTLLDCGCGIGTWMEFCRDRGVRTIGLSLSEEQATKIRKKGMTVFIRDYREPIPGFDDQFDAITLFGSSEHVCSNRGLASSRDRCRDTHRALYALLHRYLRKPSGRIFITVLVLNPDVVYTGYDWCQAYLLERHYGGYYITLENLKTALTDNHLSIVTLEDRTRDYHWTSVVAPEHFGHWTIYWHKQPFRKLQTFFHGLLTDPFLIHHWLYYGLDTWMWQFGGYQTTPLTDAQIRSAPAQLKYVLVRSNPTAHTPL